MATWSSKISHDGLHVMLWRRHVRGGKVTVSPSALADELGITAAAISRLLTDLVNEKRMTVISRRPKAPAVFSVIDPAKYWASHGYEDDDGGDASS